MNNDFYASTGIENSRFLCCPGCNENCLHQDHYRIIHQDGTTPASEVPGILVEAETLNYSPVNGTSIVNRSGPGIEITFWCETCSERPCLHIVQHKGLTLLYWQNQ
jgi:hypothetical protein